MKKLIFLACFNSTEKKLFLEKAAKGKAIELKALLFEQLIDIVSIN